MKRATLWLVGGMVLFVLLVVLIAPELLGDLQFTSGVLAVTLAAVVPGLLVMAVFASSRRGRRRLRAERDAADRRRDPDPDADPDPDPDADPDPGPTRADDPEGT